MRVARGVMQVDDGTVAPAYNIRTADARARSSRDTTTGADVLTNCTTGAFTSSSFYTLCTAGLWMMIALRLVVAHAVDSGFESVLGKHLEELTNEHHRIHLG